MARTYRVMKPAAARRYEYRPEQMAAFRPVPYRGRLLDSLRAVDELKEEGFTARNRVKARLNRFHTIAGDDYVSGAWDQMSHEGPYATWRESPPLM